ncbi:flavin-dependent dehydrogenase [Sphingomonas sp. BE138]|uniref:NAD(P)/FAD-dependent oxidoreductase n=1 Tax=Sphingomonas sp. BE138 TaxID=2817845 RepID=UPI00285ED985|nr:FAD-dependent monooxygenase [Sphingomonas sp. BE138]MDR6787757.1 flavin-dependent dehydrogenase [Sphingomonas sp. BE138]
MRREPLILGGGPAGSAAAIALARGGARPLVLERTRERGDALCGGFLSWRTLAALERLGIAADTLNPARATRLRLFTRGRVVETSLPAPGLGVSRARLDALLLAHAERHGAAIERGVTVRALDGGAARTADGALLPADALFLASGKHDIRGTARPAAARGEDPALGLRTRRRGGGVEPLVGDAIELHLFDRGYAGVVVQEDGSANVCLAIRRSRLTEAGDPDRLLQALAAEVPAFGDRLAGDATAIEAIANVPYGWRARDGTDGCYRLGDQAAVIPSLAGEGMGIALASGVSAATAWLAGQRAAAWQARFARATARPVTVARTIRAIAERPTRFAPLLPLAARLGLIDAVAAATRIAQP